MNKHRASLQIVRAVALIVGLLILSVAPARGVEAAPARDDTPPIAVSEGASPQAPVSDYNVYLPIISKPPYHEARFGFGIVYGLYEDFPAAPTLGAGWYMDWWVRTNPPQHNNMEYVRTIRVHQKLTCPLWSHDAHDRTRCPYVVPYEYIVSPGFGTIESALRAYSGSLWLIGNEMDRRDWPGGGQDEMLPEVYAVAYHDLYAYIKARDPRARVAIGGVIQGTPLRIEYVDRVWNAYQATYGTPMPVDVWNVHAFVLREELNEYGASIPPGSNARTGAYVGMNDGDTHMNMTIFADQIRAFRRWMKDHGQQQKPLIVSEYGVLYVHDGMDDPVKVRDFMTSTFDFFLNTKDCSLGYAVDSCRLVQRWGWYSLNDMGDRSGTNPYGALINPTTNQLTTTGVAYRDYATSHQDQ